MAAAADMAAVDTPVEADTPAEEAVMAGVNDLLMLKPGEDTAPEATEEAGAVATEEVEVVGTAEDTALEDMEEVMAMENDPPMLKPGEDTAPEATAEEVAAATATAEVEVVDTAEDTALAAVAEDMEEVMAGESKHDTSALCSIFKKPSIISTSTPTTGDFMKKVSIERMYTPSTFYMKSAVFHA